MMKRRAAHPVGRRRRCGAASVPAPLIDHLPHRKPSQAVGPLKRFQVVDRGPDFAGVMRPERNQLRDGAIVLGDDEAFPRLYTLQKPRQMLSCLERADFGHVTNFVRPRGGA